MTAREMETSRHQRGWNNNPTNSKQTITTSDREGWVAAAYGSDTPVTASDDGQIHPFGRSSSLVVCPFETERRAQE